MHRLQHLRGLPRQLISETDQLRREVRGFAAAVAADRQLARELAVADSQAMGERFGTCERELARFCDETVRVVRAQRETAGRLEATLQEVRALAEAQQAELGRLRETVAAQALVMPSWFWEEGVAQRVRRVLRLIQPRTVEGVAKLRCGRANDGGYVMLDDLQGVQAAISAGINDDVSWDLDMAERGIAVHQYDHTIAALPQTHPRFHFEPLRIAPADGPGAVSLATLLRERRAAGEEELILKVDIEGAEWAAFGATEADLLGLCRQVVCEFHTLHRLAEEGFATAAEACFSRFAEAGFFVAHVHGNNCGDFVNVGNVAFPETLEVLFANRRRYRPVADGVELFPTSLDMPNQKGRADLFLGSFRF